MAQAIQLRHRESGLLKTGYTGFSWTTLFFGMFPALFRGDFITFIGILVVLLILGALTAGIAAPVAMFVWAFFYNSYYTRRLLERGYVIDDAPSAADAAYGRLRVDPPRINP